MIFIALYLGYSLIVLFVLGLLTGRLLGKVLKLSVTASSLGTINSVLLGIVSLTTLTSFISLIVPIGTAIHLIILSCLIVYTFFDRRYVLNAVIETYMVVCNHKILVAIGLGWVFGGLIYASGQVTAPDTGLYHAQSVKWINEYGVVPGLGNLHFRLAFNSSWLVFSSFFDILAFDGKSYHLVNLLLFVIGVMICLKGFASIVKKNIKISAILSCLLILYFYVSFFQVPSLSTDFPATMLLLYILILVTELIEKVNAGIEDLDQRKELELHFLLICIFSCFVITIKLSTAPLLLFLPFLFLIVLKPKSIQLIAVSIFLGICVLSPYFIRNLILSGYFVFPVPQATLFSFDWSVPYKDVLLVKQDTLYWAIRPMPDYMSVPQMDKVELFQTWFNARIIRSIKLSFLLFLTPVLFLPLALICLNKQNFRNGVYLLIVQGLLLIGVLFWLVSAPDPRLGAGWILGYGLFPIAVIGYYIFVLKFDNWKIITNQYVTYVVLIGFCLWLGKVAFSNVAILGEDAYLIWTVENLPMAEMTTVEIYDGFSVYVPEERNKAFDGPLPSTPYVNYNLELRGDWLKDGFRIRDQ